MDVTQHPYSVQVLGLNPLLLLLGRLPMADNGDQTIFENRIVDELLGGRMQDTHRKTHAGKKDKAVQRQHRQNIRHGKLPGIPAMLSLGLRNLRFFRPVVFAHDFQPASFYVQV